VHSLTQMPIPLGGIAIKRNLDDKLKQKVNRVLKQSVEYAFRNPESSMAYIRSNAQEMDENVMKEHIKLYVNEFSVDLGEEGKKAISVFYNLAAEKNIIKPYENPIFIS
jgi:1,4-dihydroxy-6-naphthoate synthase